MGTPPPSSPLPTPVDSKDTPTPAPAGNSSEGQEKRHSRSATPQPHPSAPSQPQGDNVETGVSQDGAKPPEINVQGPESDQTATQQLSLSEAGSQVEDFVVIESSGGVEATKKEDDFGDFQGAVGEGTAAAMETTTQSSDSAHPSGVVGDVPQASQEAEPSGVSQGEVHQEGGPSADVNSTTEAPTNLPQPTPDTATSTGMCVCHCFKLCSCTRAVCTNLVKSKAYSCTPIIVHIMQTYPLIWCTTTRFVWATFHSNFTRSN